MSDAALKSYNDAHPLDDDANSLASDLFDFTELSMEECKALARRIDVFVCARIEQAMGKRYASAK